MTVYTSLNYRNTHKKPHTIKIVWQTLGGTPDTPVLTRFSKLGKRLSTNKFTQYIYTIKQ